MEMHFVARIFGAAVVSLFAFGILRVLVRRATAPLARRMTDSLLNVVRFFSFYALYILVMAMTLNLLRFNITALLGAAGVFGVAVGFASQTTISNIISGIFLMVEQSLRVGDVISCGGIRGRIKDIGLLSMTLRTIDNKLVRVPNEHLIKATVINLTGLKERRLSFKISAYHTQDAAKVNTMIDASWRAMQAALHDKPLVISYVATSADMIGMTVDLWVKTADVIAAQSKFIELCFKQAKAQNLECYITNQL